MTESFESAINEKLDAQKSEPNDRKSNLISRLESLNTGNQDAELYEKLVGDIVDYLFSQSLINLKYQSQTRDELSRFDYIARIHSENANSFWKFVSNELGSKYIIIECKNYSSQIKQGEVLTTGKYLYSKALRTLAIIFTRKGADTNANKMIDAMIRDEGKFILILDDDAVIKLLNGNEAENVTALFELVDNLLMSLSK